MKRILLATTIAFSSFSYADTGFYTSLKSGVSDTQFDNSKNTYTHPDWDGFSTYYQKDADKTLYPSISAALGFDFSKVSKINLRAELEYTYKDKAKFNPVSTLNEYVDSDYSETWNENSVFFENQLQNQSLMLNAYYDFKNKTKFTPYFGAGVGVTRIKNELSDIYDDETIKVTDTSNTFTWSANVGVAYKVTDNIALDLGYRYVDAGEIEFNNMVNGYNLESTADLTSHDYSLGIRYNF